MKSAQSAILYFRDFWACHFSDRSITYNQKLLKVKAKQTTDGLVHQIEWPL